MLRSSGLPYDDPECSLLIYKNIFYFMGILWCCWGGLNSRPHPYQGCALPLSYCGIMRRVIRPKPADAQEQSRPLSPDGVTFAHDGEITKTH